MGEIYVKYVGQGNYVSGVPSRDLTEDEWERLRPEAQKVALSVPTHEFAEKELEEKNPPDEGEEESEVIENG